MHSFVFFVGPETVIQHPARAAGGCRHPALIINGSTLASECIAIVGLCLSFLEVQQKVKHQLLCMQYLAD